VFPGQLHSRTLRHRLLRSHRVRLVARKTPSCPPSSLLAESVPLFCSLFHLPLNFLRSNIHTPAILGQHYSDTHCARLQNVDRVGATLRSLIVELHILHNYPAHAVVRSSTKAIIRPRLR